jgi:predicted dithiol-disulfide oxidoreductase (DUF899 family)
MTADFNLLEQRASMFMDLGAYGKERRAVTKHMTVTSEEWLVARLELLEAEKELTRRSDELGSVKNFVCGSASLADLFRGRSQLLD